MCLLFQTDKSKKIKRDGSLLLRRSTAIHAQAKANIFQGTQPREEVWRLKYISEDRMLRDNSHTVYGDMPRLRAQEAREKIKERRLATTGRTQDRHEFSRPSLQRKPFEHGASAFGIGESHAVHREGGTG